MGGGVGGGSGGGCGGRSLDGGVPGGHAFEDDVITGEDHELFRGFLRQLGGLQDWGGGERGGSGGDTGHPRNGPIGNPCGENGGCQSQPIEPRPNSWTP